MSSQSPNNGRHLANLPSFYCWAWHHVVWNIPLASLGQLSRLCPSQLLVHPQPSSLAGWCETLNSPWLSVSTAQQQRKTSVCYQHYFPPKSKTWHHTSYYEENWLYPSWNQDIFFYSLVCKYERSLVVSAVVSPQYFYFWFADQKEELKISVLVCFLLLLLPSEWQCQEWKWSIQY